jgi:hypothetical protein
MDRAQEAPITATLATVVEPELTLLKANLDNVVSDVTFYSMKNVEINTNKPKPTWKTKPALSAITARSLEVSLLSAVEGEVYCVALTGVDYSIQAN